MSECRFNKSNAPSIAQKLFRRRLFSRNKWWEEEEEEDRLRTNEWGE